MKATVEEREAEYQRMLECVQKFNVRVISTVEGEDGSTTWLVPSKSAVNTIYSVKRSYDRATFSCDCVAGSFGRYCVHRAAARFYELQRRSPKPVTVEVGKRAPLVHGSQPISVFR